ncbi:uncharacterized protein LOC129295386 isoform X1 [Prosopis cineraria]|uniref:uncharacterized protein LOC129295386 isoform X1 n=1 Tax=Prosopis cineraria TaxID=364024 RepID=UPI0024100A04|nr:uncharacterized protein LOC129295386 isoform X1 [Prosopis cineraria]
MPILIFNFSRAFPLLHFLHSSSTYQSSFPSHFLTASSDSSPLIVESHGSDVIHSPRIELICSLRLSIVLLSSLKNFADPKLSSMSLGTIPNGGLAAGRSTTSRPTSVYGDVQTSRIGYNLPLPSVL